jgi:hypothetical protein
MPAAVKDSRSDDELRAALQQHMSIVDCPCDVQRVLDMLRAEEVSLWALTTGLIAVDALKLPAGIEAALKRMCPSPSKGVVDRCMHWQDHATLGAESTRSPFLLLLLNQACDRQQLTRACA